MNTELIYLESKQTELQARVISTGAGERGNYVVLNQTIFHPQGGGQPTDQGHVTSSEGRFFIKFAEFHNGIVYHYLDVSDISLLSISEEINLEVDQQRRDKNCIIHTTGHLVSHVLEMLVPTLSPVKGYHFSDGPYVEFQSASSLDLAGLLSQANENLTSAVSTDAAVNATYCSFEEAKVIRPYLAQFIPTSKPTRIISIANYTPLPCGGTHVPSLAAIKGARLKKLKFSKDIVRASYDVF
jgi:Ser-tRNA(Ala) deacylase AlaX